MIARTGSVCASGRTAVPRHTNHATVSQNARDLNSPNELRHAQPTRKFVRKQPDFRSERTSLGCDGHVTAVSACIAPPHCRQRHRTGTSFVVARGWARGSENMMPLFVECVENDVTLGEICGVLRGVWGEYEARAF